MKRNFESRPQLFVLHQGKMVATGVKPTVPPDYNCFLICCRYGDWSGFRTLPECQAQFEELEKAGKPDGWYWVEQR